MELNIIDYYISGLEKEYIENLLKEILELLGVDGEVSIYFVNTDKMKSLNKKYRNKDIDTDVLSFEFNGIMPLEYDIFGDILISVDYVKNKSKEDNIPFKKLLAELLVHGSLHLLGYRHEEVSKETANKMISKEKEINEKLEALYKWK